MTETETHPIEPSAHGTDLAEPDARAAWLGELRSQIDDAVFAGLDITDARSRRTLGRCEARRQIKEARRAIDQMFSAAGIVAVPLGSPGGLSLAARPLAAPGDENATEIAGLASAVRDLTRARDDGEEAAVLQDMPIAGVLFLALMGTPGERAEIEPPLVLALRALRATAHGWAHSPGESTAYADVSLADLDLFARRLDATIEIARRSGAATSTA
jgi:hypothetical protein